MKNRAPLSSRNKRFHRLSLFLGSICLIATTYCGASTYYIATNGSNSATGAISQPFATLQKGNEVAVAGDTIYIRGGTYSITTPSNSGAGITITKSGTSDSKRIYFWAYPGEIPVFDFSKMTISTSGNTHGLVVSGNWLHFKGLEVRGVPMNTYSNNGVMVDGGGHDIFELMNMHHNNGNGIFVANGTGGHLILNCDAHENYDPGSNKGAGQNADGFGVHYQKSGDTTILRGCRSWWNSDDGFDCINQSVAVRLENCWNWLQGYVPGTMTPAKAGNGNGFKVGGFDMPPSKYPAIIPHHVVTNCVAFLNKAAGFYQNHQLGPSYFYNNTSYNNKGGNFNMLGYDLSTGAGVGMGIYRNNVAFTGTATSNASGADASFNSWDISGLTVAASDFLSTDTAGIYGPRKADGGLPDVKFMHLAAGSKLIDKGTNVGLPYAGAAPDLGAYEYGAATQAVAHPQTAFAKNITVRIGTELKLEGLSRRGKSGMDKGRSTLYSVTGQRIFSNISVNTGIYIEKCLTEKGR
jgi:hypothetical protein